MYYNLFLDDLRKPKDVTWIDLPLVDWVLVKSYAEFIETIASRGLPSCVSFDNDLDPKHYQMYMEAKDSGQNIQYHQALPKMGFHCAQWLVRYCLDRNEKLPQYTIHTLNDLAREDIEKILSEYDDQANKKRN